MKAIGKIRRLQQCATPAGHFVILAVDHRDNLRQYLQEANPTVTIGYDEMVEFKQVVVDALRDEFSATLLDPEFSAAHAIIGGQMPGDAGIIVSVEKWGYSGDPLARETSILPGWGVGQIVRMGGNGVKMLLYFHPDAPNAPEQEQLVRKLVGICAEWDIPFFLEPIPYSLDPALATLPTAEKWPLVIDNARRFTQIGIDVLKSEFPINVADEPDTTVWAKACAELTAASQAPWVLLSGSSDFATFAQQTQIACQAGCSGVMAGRAIWKDAVGLSGEARHAFLQDVAAPRLRRLADICRESARPWTVVYPHPEALAEGWYRHYG